MLSHWPSLFYGANGTESALHVDNFNSNFIMWLVNGTKRWRVYERSGLNTVLMYRYGMTDWGKPDENPVDVFRVDADTYPLMTRARGWETIQGPGELVFIPGGSPHAVQNLDHIVGLSMNYLDGTNVEHLALHTMTDPMLHLSMSLMMAHAAKGFPTGMDPSADTGLCFTDFNRGDAFNDTEKLSLDLSEVRRPPYSEVLPADVSFMSILSEINGE